MHQPDDIYLITQVLDGNTRSYSILIDRYRDMVFTLVSRILRNQQDAEEIAQDVFVKAYQKLGSFKGSARFSTWLYRIAFNEAISKTRKKKLPEYSLDENITIDPAMEIDEAEIRGLAPDEQRQCLNKALEHLDETENTIVTLYYMNDSSIDEIATITGLSPSNVKVKLHRTRKKMLKEINSMIKATAF